MFKHKVQAGLQWFKKLLSLRDTPSYDYFIEEIDMPGHLVYLRCVGTRIVIKFKIESLIADMSVVNGLTPGQSCVLGGCYGRLLRAALEGRDALSRAKRMDFLLSNRSGRYKITFQNRNGDIGYFDQKTGQEFVEHPLSLVSNDFVVSELDPSQACYLGILAGISVEKAVSSGKGDELIDELMARAPSLRIVK